MRLRQSLSLITGPATEPVSLSEVKAFIRLDGSSEDDLLNGLITAARSAAEQYLRRSLITQTWKLTLDLHRSNLDNLPEGTYQLPVTALYGGLPEVVPLPKGPVQSITSVVTYDTANTSSTFASANYRVDNSNDRLILNYGAVWPSNMRPQAATEITYVAGYGAASDVPQPIKTGMLIHIASLYEQRGMCGDEQALPVATKPLYAPYRIMGDRLG